MYGLINHALKEFLIARHGEDVWRHVETQLDLREPFVMMCQYPDTVTANMVAVASQALSWSPEVLLKDFGSYWVSYAAEGRYRDLFSMLGSTLPVVLQNLDLMHARIALSLPDLSPPSFRCTDVSSEGLTLHYYSLRPGLTAFVVGLVQGLAARCDVAVNIRVLRTRQSGHDHDEFRVTYVSR